MGPSSDSREEVNEDDTPPSSSLPSPPRDPLASPLSQEVTARALPTFWPPQFLHPKHTRGSSDGNYRNTATELLARCQLYAHAHISLQRHLPHQQNTELRQATR